MSDYVAVLYVHGMGNQRRYEELSRLIDALDLHAQINREQHNGWLERIKPFTEPRRSPADPTREPPPRFTTDNTSSVGYVSMQFCTEKNDPQPKQFRMYEAYWAPVTGAGPAPLEVFWWLVKQIPTPFFVMAAPWRSRQRLRRAILDRLEDRMDRGLVRRDLFHAQHFAVLRELFEKFDKADQIRNPSYAAGSFQQFLGFIGDMEPQWRGKIAVSNHIGQPNSSAAETLKSLARLWKRNDALATAESACLLLSVAAVLALVVTGVVSAFNIALEIISQLSRDTSPLSALATWLKNQLPNNALGLAALMLSVPLGRFLSRFLGDVKFFVTYEETLEAFEKRQAILKTTADILRHVLLDSACRRVVVIGHSLGSAVAFETLLSLGRQNKMFSPAFGTELSVWLPLEKIQHFVTLASPIEKIHYFFEQVQSRYRRYAKIVTRLRGDLAFPPFSNGTLPHTHWINVWDRSDPISGALYSPDIAFDFTPNASPQRPLIRVDNLEVSCLKDSINASEAHSAYFKDRQVVKLLFDVIIHDKYNFVGRSTPSDALLRNDPSLEPEWKRTWKAVYVLQLIAVALVWITLILVLVGINVKPLEPWAWAAVATTLLYAGIGFVMARYRRPLT